MYALALLLHMWVTTELTNAIFEVLKSNDRNASIWLVWRWPLISDLKCIQLSSLLVHMISVATIEYNLFVAWSLQHFDYYYYYYYYRCIWLRWRFAKWLQDHLTKPKNISNKTVKMLLTHTIVRMLIVQVQYTWQLFARKGLIEQKCLQLSTKGWKRGGIPETCRQRVPRRGCSSRERTIAKCGATCRRNDQCRAVRGPEAISILGPS